MYRIENRGTEDVPFGFIYRGEDARGYFTIVDNVLTVGGSGSGYWAPLTERDRPGVLRALRERFYFEEV